VIRGTEFGLLASKFSELGTRLGGASRENFRVLLLDVGKVARVDGNCK